MYITNNNIRYPCTGYNPTGDTVRYSGVEGLTLPVYGTVTLYSDDGFELATQDAGDYERQTYEDGALTLANAPEAEPVEPVPEPIPALTVTLEERLTDVENALVEIADIIAGGE